MTTALLMSAAAEVLAQAPQPAPAQPPGFGGINTVLNWVAWFVTAASVAGVLFVAIKMAIAFRRGEGGEAAGQLGWVMVACMLGSAAGPVVNAI